MKELKIFLSALLLFYLSGNLLLFAQSDREIVEGFKSKQKEIEEQIKKAATLDDLNSISAKIEQLKTEYMPHKALLDNSLYPDNFDKAIQKLSLAYITRNNDFVQIDVLTTQVNELKQQVEFLNQRNNELLAEVEDLKASQKKDKKTITKLTNLVAELKASILKRDRLVMTMVDSLMPSALLSESSLSSDEIKKIKTGEEKNNILDNIKKSINNHMEFLDVTTLHPQDLEAMNEQKQKFTKTWNSIGEKLVEVYGDEKTKTDQVKEIQSLLDRWGSALKQEAWNSINEEFALNGIHLQKFFNGNEFTDILSAFITDEIKNAEIKSQAECQKTYESFADSTWYANIKSIWMPYLLDHKMFTEQQKDEIEKELGDWKAAVYPSNMLWLYIVIGLIVIAGAGYFFVKKRKTTNPKVSS